MKGKSTFTQTEAAKIVELINQKLKAGPTEQKTIRSKIRKLDFYASDFGLRDGYTVNDFLRSVKITGAFQKVPVQPASQAAIRQKTAQDNRDEHYILDLCDEVLKCRSLRQHRFEFLTGDTGHHLPVDAYYPSINLVIEYREKQHTEAVPFFDRRRTVSGVTRGEQRKKYDELRRTVLPENNIRLIEFSYHEFEHNPQKRLLRNTPADWKIIADKLKNI